jgi:hypothetical protein
MKLINPLIRFYQIYMMVYKLNKNQIKFQYHQIQLLIRISSLGNKVFYSNKKLMKIHLMIND